MYEYIKTMFPPMEVVDMLNEMIFNIQNRTDGNYHCVVEYLPVYERLICKTCCGQKQYDLFLLSYNKKHRGFKCDEGYRNEKINDIHRPPLHNDNNNWRPIWVAMTPESVSNVSSERIYEGIFYVLFNKRPGKFIYKSIDLHRFLELIEEMIRNIYQDEKPKNLIFGKENKK